MSSRIASSLIVIAAAITASPAQAVVISVAARDTAGLIEAVEFANRAPGEDVIELAAGSLYALTRSAEPNRSVALPTIRSRIRILGNGAEIRGYSSQPMSLIAVAPAGSLRLENLTLAEGSQGAIVNRGDLDLQRVRVVDNTATGADAIVTNFGTLVVHHSEISFNQIAGAQRDAGIVLNYGRIDISDSALSDNSISRRYRTLVAASAILNLGSTTLKNVRVLANDALDDSDAPGNSTLVNLGNGRFDAANVLLLGNLPAGTDVMPTSIE